MDIAKVFKNGRSQAVRLPKKYRFDDSEVFINKIGDAVVLIPKNNNWQSLKDSLQMFSDDFLEERGETKPQKREELS